MKTEGWGWKLLWGGILVVTIGGMTTLLVFRSKAMWDAYRSVARSLGL